MYVEATGMRQDRIRERTSAEVTDFPDSTLPHTSGFSIHQGKIVHGSLGDEASGKVGELGGNNLHAQGGCRIGLTGQACHAKVYIHPVKSTSSYARPNSPLVQLYELY